MLDSVSDDAFARYVRQTGMATPAQIEEARKLAPVPLAEALVVQGVITPTQKETVEKKLEAQREGVGELGGCRLLKKLGEGGMGAVYLAEDAARKRKVAIKVLPKKHATDAEFLKRFRREIDAATQLDHPNIVQAFTAGEERGHHFFIMEYCEGESLRKRIDRLKFLPSADACRIVLQVAHGLRHAHDKGIIHRDVKPENLIVTPSGAVKILDLGLAKNLEDANASFRTATGSALGTPHYISPEQARGDKGVDGRTDIYSLGATFYHLITGQVPFNGSSIFEIIQKHLMEQLADPRDVRPEIPQTVVQVVRKMLAKKPDDRHRDCGELIQDLDRLAANRPPLTQPLDAALSSLALPKGSAPRARRMPMLLAGAAAAAALVGIVAWAAWPDPEPAPVVVPKKAAPAVAKLEPPKIEPPEPEPAKPEPSRPEPPKPEPVKPEPEIPRPEPPKPEPPKPEPPRPEPPNPEPAKPEPVDVEPPPPPPKPSKSAVPDAAGRTAAETAFRTRFKDDLAKTAPADKAAFAKKLLALDPAPTPADQHHRLLAARDLAAQGGDPAGCLAAVDRLAESFVVDAAALKADGLIACTWRTTDGAETVARSIFALNDEMVSVDRYDLATRLLARAKTIADQLRKDDLRSEHASRAILVAALAKEFPASHARTLAEKPDDPAANLAMGRFLCFAKEEWERGLPLLAKGSDAVLRSLAEKDLSTPDVSDLQRDLCEGWLSVAEKETGKLRKDNVTERARFWFDQVESKLLPADRPKIAKRLETLERNAAPKAAVPKAAGAAPNYAARMDLLARLAPDHLSRFRGNWRLAGAGVLVSSTEGFNQTPTLIHLPCVLGEEYDLIVEAQRIAGTQDIVFALASLRNEFAMGLDGWGGQSAGLHGPNGPFSWNRAGRGGIFNDGRVHTIRFEVRKAGAVMKVDEEPIVTLSDYRQSSIPATMRDQRPQGCVSISTVQSSFRITKVTYCPIRSR